MDPPNELSWVVWAATSPYSPLNLRDLPQPIPRDAPAELQDGVFTFEDAFEDLLAVSQGRPLVDIDTKHESRRLLRQMFPDGEDPAFWVRRLQSQRLLDNANFFPLQPRSLWPHDVWEGIHREFARAAEEARRAEDRWVSRFEDRERKEDEGGEGKRRGLFEELDKIIRSFESGMNGEDREKKKGEDASTEDDLYSSVQNAVSSGAKSLGTLVKTAWDGVADIRENHSSYTRWGQQKGERVESKEEFTDERGNLHEKKIIRTLDDEGREIGREVHVRVRSPPPKQESFPEVRDREQRPEQKRRGEGSEENNKGPDQKPNTKNDKGDPPDDNSGWFWK